MQRLTSRRHLRLPQLAFSTSSAIYSTCWIEFLLLHKDLRGSASSHYLTIRLQSASIRHFERVWSDHDRNYLARLFQSCSEQSCFNHDSRNALSDVNTFHNETCFTRDQTNQLLASCERSLPLNFLCPKLLCLESWGAFVSIGCTKSESGKNVL